MTREEEFSIFWKSYPRRIAKENARKAFEKAIKRTSLQDLLDGITKYVANKPDWQDYAHPASWLNGGRWQDEWEPQQPKAPRYKESYVQYNVDRYSTAPEQPQRPVLPKNHFLNTYGK